MFFFFGGWLQIAINSGSGFSLQSFPLASQSRILIAGSLQSRRFLAANLFSTFIMQL
jgi:hypothetical protein